jgi:starch synthase
VETAGLWEGRLAGKVPVYFVDAPKYFDRDGLYRDGNKVDFSDNDDRFILFSRAVLETAKALDFRPDIVHANDWQTGLIPAYLETLYLLDAFFLPTASVFTVHNIAYQGVFPKNTLFRAGFSWSDFTPDRLEFFDQVNFLKAGLVFAHGLNTVGPTYAREISSNPVFGRGMEGILSLRKDFIGILNGLDRRIWNPSKDPHLARSFTSANLAARKDCKTDLQREAGLDPDSRAPLLGMVSRMDPQKGVDIILEILEGFLKEGIQAVFLGSGDPEKKEALRGLAKKHPGRAAVVEGFNDPMAHKIYGGADLFLMPSLFEPCGLGQMIALRYGCVPVVTPTGGLLDTVEPFNGEKHTGVGFMAQRPEASAYRQALAEAVSLYRSDPAAWRGLQQRGMSLDFGWGKSVEAYVALYERALERKRSIPR